MEDNFLITIDNYSHGMIANNLFKNGVITQMCSYTMCGSSCMVYTQLIAYSVDTHVVVKHGLAVPGIVNHGRETPCLLRLIVVGCRDNPTQSSGVAYPQPVQL